MRLLSTILLGTLLTASLTTVTSPAACHAKTPAPPAAGTQAPDELKRFEVAAAKLNLSPEQKAKVARLVAEVRASVKKLDAGSETPAQKQLKINALRTDAREKLDHILTVAQDRELKKLLGRPKAGAPAHK
ncbi:MAG: hypothetical protein ACO1SX_11650 [Actinomycetota bacterium]